MSPQEQVLVRSEIVLGVGDVTGGRDPDVLVRRADGSLVILEADGCGGTRRYVCAGCFDGAELVGVADVTGDGLADLIAVTARGEVVAFPHAGVFWPQDPAVTFGRPVALH